MAVVRSRRDAMINVRVPSDLKVKLEQLAAADGVEFSTWLNNNLEKLQQQYPGLIEVVEN